MLEAAGLAGDAFAVAEVADACERSTRHVRERLEALADQHRIVERRGKDTYAFVHELHRDVLRDLMTPERRAQLHLPARRASRGRARRRRRTRPGSRCT